MFTPARLRLTAALLVALLGFAVAMCGTTRELLEDPLAMQTPQR